MNTRMSNPHFRSATLCAIVAMALTAIVPALARMSGPDGDSQHDNIVLAGDTLRHGDRRAYDVYFLEAVRQKLAGHADSALTLYRRCIDIDSTAAEAYYGCAEHYAAGDSDSLAFVFLKRAAALCPDNDTYQEHVAQYHIGTGDYDKAITAYENLYSHHRDRSDVLGILLQLYRQKKDYAMMLNTLSRIEQTDGENDELTLMRMNVYEMGGDTKKAGQTLRALVAKRPGEPSYKVMLGNWLMNHDGKAEALGLFKSALADDPGNSFARNSLYDYYRSEGNGTAAISMRDAILLSQSTEVSDKVKMLQQVIKENDMQGGDSTAVLQLFDRVAAAERKSSDIYYLKGLYMQHKAMPADSVATAYRQALEKDPENSAARMQLIQIVWGESRWDDLATLSRQGTQYSPDDLAFYYLLGLAYAQKDDDKAALEAFKRGTGVIDENSIPSLASDLYAFMGDILYRMSSPDEAFAAYDNSLKWKSDNISALNNYAYYLSELRRDLSKAETMSRKTVDAEPTNPTYLDTYAWIMFLQKRYDEARAYIDRAVECDTASVPSPVVTEHAGDIYSLCGDTARAVEFWQKAIEAGGDKAMLEKKIKSRKYIPRK